MNDFLVMEDIVKDFPGVRALDRVSLRLKPGTILGLCGENGAGKSTLMKVLSGIYTDYQGTIRLENKPVRFRGTADAEAAGIAIIHQELNLFPHLSIAENMFLGRESGTCIDWPDVYRRCQDELDRYGIDLDARTQIKDIKLAQAQLVEIIKALTKQARILVLDEPTSALSESETAKLFTIMRNLKEKQVTMIYISHKLDEIRSVCDEVLALRDGRSIGEPKPVSEMNKEDIIRAMVGRDITALYPRFDCPAGPCRLEVRNWSVAHPLLVGEHVVEEVSFSAYAGRILGIYGLMGSGRTELLTSIFAGFGDDEYSGELLIDGAARSFHHPLDAINAGLGLVTEDRKLLGLILGLPVAANITLTSLDSLVSRLAIDDAAEWQRADHLIDDLHIKTPTRQQLVRNLSGGNQQKVVLAKWLATKPKILMLDEPTRGVDIGAKAEIYTIMNRLKADNLAIIMVTSDLPELMGMSDTIMVLREGRVQGIFERDQVTVEKLGALATGNV